MIDGVPNHATFFTNNVMDPYPMDDHVAHKLDGDPGAVGYVDPHAAAVDGLVALHYHLLLEVDHHVMREYNPQWLLLDHGVP